MRQKSRWPLFFIGTVLFLTIYNILPTLFFYSKPLDKAISTKKATQIAENSLQRVNNLKEESTLWITSFCDLLEIEKPDVALYDINPQYLSITFTNENAYKKFKKYLPNAGALIPFYPSELHLSSLSDTITDSSMVNEKSKFNILVQTNIPIIFKKEKMDQYFSTITKQRDGKPTEQYKEIVLERFINLTKAISSTSTVAQNISTALNSSTFNNSAHYLLQAADQIIIYGDLFQNTRSLEKNFYQSVLHGYFPESRRQVLASTIQNFSSLKEHIQQEKISP